MKAVEVSIIVANYNKQAYIADTIESVLNQSLKQFELIIVDDASSDGSVNEINKFLEDPRIHFYPLKENKGANYCRNFGLQKALGEYIVFLDADDVLASNCLKSRVQAALLYPGANLLVFTMGVFSKKVGDDQRKWIPNASHPLKKFLQHELPWSILQPLWKRDFLLELGGFDVNFKRLQDVELNTRALMSDKCVLKQIGGESDCYYRIDEERKNYTPVNFLKAWVQSVIQYLDKMAPALKPQSKKYLKGTVFETYIQLLVYHKRKTINSEEFQSLESKLFEEGSRTYLEIFLFSVLKFYNLNLPRIPGINRTIKKLIIHL